MIHLKQISILLLTLCYIPITFAGRTFNAGNYIKQEDGSWQHLAGQYKGQNVKSRDLLKKLNSGKSNSNNSSSDDSEKDTKPAKRHVTRQVVKQEAGNEPVVRFVLFDTDEMDTKLIKDRSGEFARLASTLLKNPRLLTEVNALLNDRELLDITFDQDATVCRVAIALVETEYKKPLRHIFIRNNQICTFQCADDQAPANDPIIPILNENPEDDEEFVCWYKSPQLQNNWAFKQLRSACDLIYWTAGKPGMVVTFMYAAWHLASANCTQTEIAANFTTLCRAVGVPEQLGWTMCPLVVSALAFKKWYDQD